MYSYSNSYYINTLYLNNNIHIHRSYSLIFIISSRLATWPVAKVDHSLDASRCALAGRPVKRWGNDLQIMPGLINLLVLSKLW